MSKAADADTALMETIDEVMNAAHPDLWDLCKTLMGAMAAMRGNYDVQRRVNADLVRQIRALKEQRSAAAWHLRHDDSAKALAELEKNAGQSEVLQ